jgi:subtilisin family serine protease
LRPTWVFHVCLGAIFLCFTAIAKPLSFVPGQILLRPKSGISELALRFILQNHKVLLRTTLSHINVHIVNVPPGEEEAFLAALRNDPSIEFAERDALAEAAFIPNDPYVLSGAEWHLAKIQAPAAWDLSTGTPDVLVAVLDSGIDGGHPDLLQATVPGYDFVSNDSDTTDDFGHGTAVAGTIIAAGNNNLGVAGIAYGCKLLPVKVVNASGFAAYSTVAQGIRFAVEQGAKVINLSIAGDTPSSALQSAIDYAWSNNVVVVAAAGNSGNSLPQYPAACNHVLGVSATEPDDSLASFSSFGSSVSLSAPGDNIWTTQIAPAAPYGSWRGTSFASPLVAGAAALLVSVNPSLSCTQVVGLLETTADDLGIAGYDAAFGYGRLNVYRAVAIAAALPGAEVSTNTSPITNPPPVFPPQTNVSPAILATLFRPIKGTYAGLVFGTNGILPANSGYFAIALNGFGRFSGRINVAGKHRGFSGHFGADGGALIELSRMKQAPLLLALHADLVEHTDQVSGSFFDGTTVSVINADRNCFNARTNPPPQAGVHPFLLDRSDSESASVGDGQGRIGRGGWTTVKGMLEDGRRFVTSSTISKTGDYPFYLSLNRGTEVVIGWLNFPPNETVGSGGSAVWVNTGTNAFARVLQAASP